MLVVYPSLTPAFVCGVLQKAGLRCDPEQIRLSKREERWVVFLPGQRLAWFAASETGRARLQTERSVLYLLETCCDFGAPRILIVSEDGSYDVRTMVPSTSEPWQVSAAVAEDRDLSRRLGAAIGRILPERAGRFRLC